ncbi:MAG TPA: hypothetical protein VE136_05305 [Anaerolineales bacterium]|jgi:hypothetical protein|nr:hypothetical protein [Anaerolineales bacterium]
MLHLARPALLALMLPLMFFVAACTPVPSEMEPVLTLPAEPTPTITVQPSPTSTASLTPTIVPSKTLIPTSAGPFNPFPTGPTPTALFIFSAPDEPECERDQTTQDLKVDLGFNPETCVVWVDEFEDEMGFRVILKYWSSGEIFVYEVGSNVTQLVLPREHAPRLDESQEQALRRHDIQISVLALRPGHKPWPVGEMGLVADNPDLRKLPTATPTPTEGHESSANSASR